MYTVDEEKHMRFTGRIFIDNEDGQAAYEKMCEDGIKTFVPKPTLSWRDYFLGEIGN